MKFRKLDKLVLTRVYKAMMLEVDTKTEVETKVGGNWVHDANDTVR